MQVVEGTVVPGEQRGRTIGFPTANLIPDAKAPSHGIYACIASLAGEPGAWAAAVSIGVRPTFDTELGELIEAHLLDFTGDLYGKHLRLEFLAKLREELVFDSVEELQEQIARDIGRTREITGPSLGGDRSLGGAL
jgi:riboflavin kinase/FMN adenylyltransferase